MADNYLGFSFNGTAIRKDGTEDITGFIINSGDDLKFSSTPAFSNEIVSPKFGQKSYYTGTTIENRTFSFTIILDEATLDEYRTFLRLFGMKTEGILFFDYNTNYGYEVKLASMGEGSFTVVPDTIDKYHIEIDLEFITTKDWAAEWLEGATPVYWNAALEGSLVDNEVPENFISGTLPTLTLNNAHNVDNYYIIEFTNILIIKNDTTTGTTIVNVALGTAINGTYYSEYGIVIDASGNFAAGIIETLTVTQNGTDVIYIDATSTVVKITPVSREIL